MTTYLLEEDSDDSPTPHGLRLAPPAPVRAVKVIRVLLVEDNTNDANLIRQYFDLGPLGLRFDVACAARLLDAQAALAKGNFDVIVSDLGLPDSTGIRTFDRLHEQAPNVPLVLLTGDGDEELALRALRHGAEDYLVKGAVSPSLLIRSIRYAIERSRRRTAERALRDSGTKLQAARKIQQKLFPAKAPQLAQVSLGGRTVAYDLGGASYPADEMGGDYFDYIPMMHGALGLVIGDVSGHGYGPALLMVETRAHLRSLARTFDDVSAILTMTNRILLDDITDDHFVTLFFGQLDPLAGTFSYSSAGHTAGFWLSANGDVKQRLGSTAFPLGVMSDGEFPAYGPLQLEPGDVVVLLTDGVLEAQAPDGTSFGAERTLAIIRHYLADSARDIVSNLYHSVCAFVQCDKQIDDATAVVMKVRFVDGASPQAAAV